MNNGDPLVTVNVLSYNRCDDLRNTLQRVFEQDYKNIEVIVVDNASSDGTSEMVEKDFPDVKIIRLHKNIGIAGWNEGFKAAKGDFILVLDDDSYPTTNAIQKALKAFKENEKLGIVAFKIFNTRNNSSETEDFMEQPLFFTGCGALFRSDILKTVGLFNEQYFIYYHELDYSARCYNAGYQIKYLFDAEVIHEQSMKSRGNDSEDPFRSEYRYYHYFLSYSIFLIQNFDFRFTIKYLLKYVMNRLLICILYGYYWSFLKALSSVVRKFASLRRDKRLLKPEIQRFYRNGNIPFIDRSYIKFAK